MTKKFINKSDKNHGVGSSPSEDRLRTLKKQGLIAKAKKAPQAQVARFLTLRYDTIKKTLESEETAKKPSPFHKTAPTSQVPNFQNIRHSYGQKSRILLETHQGEHYNPVAQTPLKQVQHDPKVYQSGGGGLYKKGSTHIHTNNMNLNLLQRIEGSETNKENSPKKRRNEELETEITTVELSYSKLVRPAGVSRPINNRASHGGYSANDLALLKQDEFLQGLIQLDLATEDEALRFADYCHEHPYEHTHKFASHFGVLKTREGQTIDPRNPESTFVAPAALNTEMMLFEKFVDFLLYKNHFSNGFHVNQKSVQYTCELQYLPNTNQPAYLKLEVKDLHTGKTFSQVWDEPYKVVEKPSAARYSALLSLLKASLDDKPVLGAPIKPKL